MKWDKNAVIYVAKMDTAARTKLKRLFNFSSAMALRASVENDSCQALYINTDTDTDTYIDNDTK
jgi:hypothetical protein